MKMIVAVALLAASLNGEEGGKIDDLLSVHRMEKIDQVEEYAEIEFANDESDAKIIDEVDGQETAQVLEESSPKFEVTSSLGGVIEQNTAKLIQTLSTDELVADEKAPELEDLADLAKKPAVTFADPPSKEEVGYESLPISVEEKQKIAKILVTMAENNVFSLLFEKKHLERLGHDIRHVHPLRFLGTVFNDPRLVHCMHRIRRSSFKWDGFIDGFTERFKEEIRSGNINAYIPGLAESLDVKSEDLQAYVNYADFQGMVIFLLEKSRR